MSGKGFNYGLNLTKKQPGGLKPASAKRKPIFDEDAESDKEENASTGVEEIGEFGGVTPKASSRFNTKSAPAKAALINKPNAISAPKKLGPRVHGDLSSTFSSKKHASTAEEIDPSIYDYDAVYDSLKPQKVVTEEDKARKPKYMSNLLAAAAVRKRDTTIAEEKKLAREREAEGDEFADKEKFVTSAYKKQQEENRRLEEEERIKEAKELKSNKAGGMTGFYKNILEKGDQRHAEIIRAAEERAKNGPQDEEKARENEIKTDAELAKEVNEKIAGAIAVNDEGQVVDKRQLLKGGLNILPKVKPAAKSAAEGKISLPGRSRPGNDHVGGGSKQAIRERQTRMMEAQLEQATKRAMEADEEDQAKIERASKSRKTEGEILGAKERYLARKREAEEAKKRGELI